MSFFDFLFGLLPTRTILATPKLAPVPSPAPVVTSANRLAGKPLRYLIGFDGVPAGSSDTITEVGYDCDALTAGICIAYCNLFDEKNTGKLGAYLHESDTAEEYNEGQVDPKGPGWQKNLREQFARRQKSGFVYIELDNPDAYKWPDVKGAIDLASTYGLHVIAKNPGICDNPTAYVAHPNVYGIIVEKGAGTPESMDALRRKAGRGSLPVWFVGFGSAGAAWTKKIAPAATRLGMGVTQSTAGEYGSAVDVKPSAN